MKDWPSTCATGHPLGPGKASLSYALCETCDVPGRGHHHLHCGTCRTRLWLGHPGATWETWDGYRWQPVNAPDAPPS